MLVLDFKREKNAHLPKPLRHLHAKLLKESFRVMELFSR